MSNETAIVPRQALFDAVTTMRRTEALLSAFDAVVRGVYLPMGSLSGTELSRVHNELAAMREKFEALSMRLP